MTIAPNTEVRLLTSVPLFPNYEHQITFADKAEQASYFIGRTSHTFLEFTFQREETAIKVPTDYDSLYNCNYVMYKNPAFSGKWFYAFVTKKEYINPNATRVFFEVDIYQTWQFDLTFKPSFVEREHRDRWNVDGSPVINTLDEGIDYGKEYDTVSVQNYVPYGGNYFLIIACKEPMDVNNGTDVLPTVNGSPQPLTYYVHPFKLSGGKPNVSWNGMAQTYDTVMDVLKALYKNTNAVGNIVSLYVTEHVGEDMAYDSGTDTFTFPMNFEPVNIQDGTTNFVTFYVDGSPIYDKSFSTLGNKYDGYAAVNESKLLMYPYTVLVMDDFKGNRIEYKNEYINSDFLIVTVRGSMGTSNKVVYTLEQYNSTLSGTDLETMSMEHSIINDSPNDVPIITDLLSAYLQGNRNQIANQKNSVLFNQSMGVVGSIMSGNVMGGVSTAGNGYLQMQGIVAKQQDIKNIPPQIAKMGSNTSFDYGHGYTGVYLIKKQVKEEYRKKLEDFFKMYGYKINEVKTPNLNTRTHFNFVKTVGANIHGNVPQDDMVRIKSMFDNGVTLWHTTDVGNYALANGEV